MNLRERLTALEQFGIKLGLDNITRLLDALGRPQDAWPAVHIAGTNGKGSVTAMVERGLRAAGHRTGRYTSPHLAHLEERFALDGEPVSAARLDEVLGDVFQAIDALRSSGGLEAIPTFFEATTAAAFELFRREKVDVAVIEVGLGGRYDATNVLSPLVTAISSIAFDHQKYLGDTLEAIAGEKAGIAKQDVPMVVGNLPAGPLAVVREACARAGAPLVLAEDGVNASWEMHDGRTRLALTTPVRAYAPVTLALAGRHQVRNAVVAARVLETLAARGIAAGEDAVTAGLRDAQWPARLEWMDVGAGRVLVDAAHNPEGAAALATYVRDLGLPAMPLVLAMMRDKDVDGILRELLPVASAVVVTEVDSPRCLPAEELASRIRDASPGTTVDVAAGAEAALARALAQGPQAIVAGSIFLVGPLRDRLRR